MSTRSDLYREAFENDAKLKERLAAARELNRIAKEVRRAR